MYWTIRNGTDGIGLDFPFGLFADDIASARHAAAVMLRERNYTLQADRGLFTVHGHTDWMLQRHNNGYRIVPVEEGTMAETSRKTTIVKLDAKAYAQRIDDCRTNRPTLTSADANEIENEIRERTEKLLNDLS